MLRGKVLLNSGEGRLPDSAKAAITAAGLVVLYYLSVRNYLLFHSLAEGFSIAVAAGTFMLAWGARRFMRNQYLLFLGIALLYIGFMDMIHAMGYKGMGVFPNSSANLSTQLWIATRSLNAVAFVAAPLLMRRRLNLNLVNAAFSAVCALLLVLIFTGNFPDCFIEGSGLTPFKTVSEYVISLIFAASIWLLWRNKAELDPTVLRRLTAATILLIASELSFSSYVHVYDFWNFVGHSLKIGAYYQIYKALVETGLERPYTLLFRELKQSEEALTKSLAEKEMLIREVHHRVKNNLAVVSSMLSLQSRKLDNPETQGLLLDAETRVKSISLIHERLYKGASVKDLDVTEYMRSLCVLLFRTYRTGGGRVTLKQDIAPVTLDVEFMLPCGLILNELVSNALKYAFRGISDGEIAVSFKRNADGLCELSVADNGVGLPAGFSPGESDTLGMKIIGSLVRQLSGELRITRPEGGGTRFTVSFRERPIS